MFKCLLILSVRSGNLSKLDSIMSVCCVIMLQTNGSCWLVPIQCYHVKTVGYPVYLQCYHVETLCYPVYLSCHHVETLCYPVYLP